MDFIKKNCMWITIAGCALVLIGCFLPFAKVSVLGFSQAVNYIDGDGVIVLIAIIISAVLVFLKKEKISLISTGIATIVTLYDAINVSHVTGSSSLGGVSLGIGFWIILIGLIIAIVLPLLPKNK